MDRQHVMFYFLKRESLIETTEKENGGGNK